MISGSGVDIPQEPEKEFRRVSVKYIHALIGYLQTKPFGEVNQFLPPDLMQRIPPIEGNEDKSIDCDKDYLQAIVNYLQYQPYIEVHLFIDAVVDKQQPQQPQQPQPTSVEHANIAEVTPEGFDSSISIIEEPTKEAGE